MSYSMNISNWAYALRILGVGAALSLGGQALQAANLCVNPSGTNGCTSTIGAAVASAGAGDVIRVAKGTYHEDVFVDRSVSLIGDGSTNTIIDASGLLNGINIDGCNFDATAGVCNPRGLAHIAVSGFTVQNANAQGIVVTNAYDVTIFDNHVTGNDRSLAFPNCPAPGFPVYFIAGEGFDCGEAIHLSGVDHSVVVNNVVDSNAGGILLSDDTGQTHDNLISANLVQNNPFDCGITLASHNINAFYTPPPPGVFNNRIVGNTSSANGLSSGEGAGVGIFAAAPGAQNYGNTVSGNTLTGNALPGVAMHSHAPGQVLKDHVIVDNQISGNGSDGDLGTGLPTMGISITNYPPAPVAAITGIVISQNTFKDEGLDIAVNTSVGSDVSAHFNSFLDAVGIDNLGSGSISATTNWWKCSAGPGAKGCSATSGSNITTNPWLTSPF